eukprot:m.62606 g.62606  ORF g.62606 m.62606 type:complete len:91 (+) comp16290_c0_seq1:253-525(+)
MCKDQIFSRTKFSRARTNNRRGKYEPAVFHEHSRINPTILEEKKMSGQYLTKEKHPRKENQPIFRKSIFHEYTQNQANVSVKSGSAGFTG